MSSSSSNLENLAQSRYFAAVEPDHCLAQTMRISQVLDIPGADKIQAYVVGGWKCVATKNAFKVGDLVIYIHIGAVLEPDIPQWKFLEGFPLKTKKIRGVISQGLIGPLSWLTSYAQSSENYETINKSDNVDVTKMLRVRKYVEPEESGLYSTNSKQLSASIPRPSFIPKTDAERVQNITQNQWQELKGKLAWNTRKEDGTSTTYWFKAENDSSKNESKSSEISDLKSSSSGEFGICSRNCAVNSEMKGQEHYMLMNKKFNIEQELRALNRSLAIQGEIVGPKINGNRLQLSELDFRVFGMWDISKQCYLDPAEVWELCLKMKLHTVPLISTFVIGNNEMSSEFWLQQAESQKYLKNVQAEGVVFMVHDQLRHLRFKAISNNYLLKHNL